MKSAVAVIGVFLMSAACAACAAGRGAALQENGPAYATEECPIPGNIVAYPVSAIALDGVVVDSVWLGRWLHAVVHRWQVPSNRRASFTGYERVTSRVLPDLPRWADDWKPSARHRAEVVVTARRTTSAGPALIRTPSGDPFFDRSLSTITEDPMPASPPLPPLPPEAPDSVRLLLRFGAEPGPGERSAVVRFARQQRPVRVVRGMLVLHGPPGARAVAKYDVDASGRVVRGTVQVLEASDPGFAQAVETALQAARFTPAHGDCVPVRLSVVQSFGR